MKSPRRLVLTFLVMAGITVGLAVWRGAGECSAAVIYPTAPAEGKAIVIENVRKTLHDVPAFLGGVQFDELTISEPHRVYYAGKISLAAGQLLSVAKPAGWRYLLMRGTNAVGEATVNADSTTGALKGFNSMGRTRFADETLEAVCMAAKLPAISKQDYELRYLGVPGANFVAIWFHATNDDIILPLPPGFGRVKEYAPYTESEIIQALKKEPITR